MKKAILFFIMVVVYSTVFSQPPEKEFFEKNRKIPRGTGISVLKSRAIDFKKKDFQLKSRSDRVYIKLKSPLSKSVADRLKKKGIKLNEYVTDKTLINREYLISLYFNTF